MELWIPLGFELNNQKFELVKTSVYLGVCGEQGGPRHIRHFLIMGLDDPVGASQCIAGTQRGHLDSTEKLLGRKQVRMCNELSVT